MSHKSNSKFSASHLKNNKKQVTVIITIQRSIDSLSLFNCAWSVKSGVYFAAYNYSLWHRTMHTPNTAIITETSIRNLIWWPTVCNLSTWEDEAGGLPQIRGQF